MFFNKILYFSKIIAFLDYRVNVKKREECGRIITSSFLHCLALSSTLHNCDGFVWEFDFLMESIAHTTSMFNTNY